MRNRRDRRAGHCLVVHVTNRLIHGMPFTAKRYMREMILGILARGQSLYPAQIVACLFMGNHYHMVLSGNAAAISPFMNYVDGQLAAALKQLCPMYRNHSKLWKSRFKEQRLCTAEAVIKQLIYIYANPIRAGLVRRIEDYPGFNTFKMHKDGTHRLPVLFVPRRNYMKSTALLENMGVKDHAKFLREMSTSVEEFRLFPDIWKRCFPESKDWSSEEIFNRIRLGVGETQQESLKTISKTVGRRALLKQSRHKDYVPTKKSGERTPFLICEDAKLRLELIKDYWDFCKRCRTAWKKIKQWGTKVSFPKGAYMPGSPFLMQPG